MRRCWMIAAVVELGGCQLVLGIDDPVTGDRCDAFDRETCEIGETCDVVFETGALDCRPAGDVTANLPCEVAEECEVGLSCLRGMCRTLCNETSECDTVAGELQCNVNVGNVRVCDSACDLLAAGNGGCRDGFECEILYNYANNLTPLCTPLDDGEAFQLGQECYDLDQCRATMGCYDDNGLDDGVLVGRCTELCNLDDAAAGPCPGQCVALWSPTHGVPIGVCPID